jgi:hypothetical protein
MKQAGAFVLKTMGLVGFSQLLPRFQIPIALNVGQVATVSAKNEVTKKTEEKVDPRPLVAVRCPMDFTPVDVPADGVYGLKRVTRHPTFWSLGMLGLGTALATPLATEV